MGNKSGSEFGGIMIRTEKMVYYAGDVVKGNIYLHIIKEGYHGKLVQLRIFGKEKSNWTTGSSNHKETHHGKNIFYQDTVVVHKFLNDNLIVGQFIFPFEVHLSPNLPGTFYYQNDTYDVIAKISYKICVRVISSSKSINDIKNKQYLVIREQIKEVLQQKHKKESSQIISGCCFKKGISSIEANVMKNIYFPNEFVKFNYDIDNSNCQLDVKNVVCVIVNQIRLKSNQNTEHTFKFKLNSQYYKGLLKGHKIQPLQKQEYSLQLINQKNPIENINPSILGNFVNSTYYLKIKPIYEGCTCCSNRPSLQIPFTIYTIPSKEEIQPLIEPENWNPQAFQTIVIKSNNNEKTNNLNQELQQMSKPMYN